MKKKELIQLIMDAAGVRSVDRTTALHLNNSFNTTVGQLFVRDQGQWAFYRKRITLAVTERVASLEGIPIIQTRTNANGVLSVYPTASDDKTVFYPAPYYLMRSSADVTKLSGVVYYSVTPDEVTFSTSLPKEVTELYADIVPELQYYEDDDEIPLPTGIAQVIIDQAVQALKGNIAHQPIINRRPVQ
jgi:hypothetical protein